MCFSSSSSKAAQTTTTTNQQSVADGGSTSVGAYANVQIDQSGLEGDDLKNVLGFLEKFGNQIKDTATESLDTIKQAQLNQKNENAGTAVELSKNLAWPLAVAVIGTVAAAWIMKKWKLS